MNKVNYYFVSSPMHLLFSVNTALSHPEDVNIVIANYYLSSNQALFTSALQRSSIFDQVVSFDDEQISGKRARRKARFQVLTELVKTSPPQRIYTGTDRRVEFQFAMSQARRINPQVEGHYLDEGTQTYLGHKHMHSIQHKYIDPILKKIAYGNWWKNPIIIGASSWINYVHAAFPQLVHSALSHKEVKQLSREHFNHPQFIDFNRGLLATAGVDTDVLNDIDYVILLTVDNYYDDILGHVNKLIEILSQRTTPQRIAIKAHPRSHSIDALKERHPDVLHIDNRVGFELLLPQFSENCTFIGDVTSSLFTIKWLNKDQSVFAVKLEQAEPAHFAAPMARLLQTIGVEQVSYAQLEAIQAAR